jgi:bacillithiol biosynthesis deacetylase BshB1
VSRADALFIGAHPDDIELTSGGLAALLASHGHRVVLADLTRGEAGTRGAPEQRAREAAEAARALGAVERLNLGLPDLGLDRHDRAQLTALAGLIRDVRPELVVAPDVDDEHPDHVEAHHLARRACYVAGVGGFQAPGQRFRPGRLMFSVYRSLARPHLVVDVSRVWDRRCAAIECHQSQIDPAAGGATYLTARDFLASVEGRARAWGASIGVTHGEAYRMRGPVPITDARALLAPRTPAP